ncbi:MAG TPA: DUF3574 domain-containing protein [Gemmatimonadales bacterium]|nr:DUF3574 domain-containing protein [Gemmatimonadales bacterium]
MMCRIPRSIGFAGVGAALTVCAPPHPPPAPEPGCTDGAPYLRTILSFGLARGAGTISQDEWAAFLRDEITPQFPDGLTVSEAAGQWRGADGVIVREPTKVLLLVHPRVGPAQAAVQTIIARYKHLFEQEAVLWRPLPSARCSNSGAPGPTGA